MFVRGIAVLFGLVCASLAHGEAAHPFLTAATNAVQSAAESDRCRWGTFRIVEFWNDDILQDELETELNLSVPFVYAEAKSGTGRMHEPAIGALYEPFIAALRRTPTLRQIAGYAAARGFSTNLCLAVEKFQLRPREDGRRCFYGGVTCCSVATNHVKVLEAMLGVVRRAKHERLDEVEGTDRTADGVGFSSRFWRPTDGADGAATAYRFQVGSEPECALGQAQGRRFHAAVAWTDVDARRLFALLSRPLTAMTAETLLAEIGRPAVFIEERHPCCGRTDLVWQYEFTDRRDDGAALRHTLRICLTRKGVCARWHWHAEVMDGKEER